MKQLLWMIVTFFCGAFLYKLDFYYQRFFRPYLYFWFISFDWFIFFWYSYKWCHFLVSNRKFFLQPSEYAKVFTLLFFARIFEKKSETEKTGTYLRTFFIVLIPSLLILLQPDPGSVLVYFSFC